MRTHVTCRRRCVQGGTGCWDSSRHGHDNQSMPAACVRSNANTFESTESTRCWGTAAHGHRTCAASLQQEDYSASFLSGEALRMAKRLITKCMAAWLQKPCMHTMIGVQQIGACGRASTIHLAASHPPAPPQHPVAPAPSQIGTSTNSISCVTKLHV